MRSIRTILVATIAAMVLTTTLPVLATVSDPWITAKTKLTLLTTDGVDVLDVDVDTVNGRVTLHGEVQSEAEREEAVEVARDIDGVTEVNNQLQVVPKREYEQVEASDAQLKDRGVEQLDREPTVDDSDIEGESVHDGTVVLAGDAKTLSDHENTDIDVAVSGGVARLAGTVDSQADRLTAAVVARGVPGVRAVRNDLDVSS